MTEITKQEINEIQNGLSDLTQLIVDLYNTKNEINEDSGDAQGDAPSDAPSHTSLTASVYTSLTACDELIKKCDTVLENIQEMENDFNDEKDRLCVLINRISRNLPFIERIRYRAEARGVILGEFTLGSIPKEASPFYGDDEFSYEIIRLIEEERSKNSKP